MQFIITWQTVLLFLTIYFGLRYIYFALYMWNSGSPDPFNPFSSIDANPYRNTGYHQGRKDAANQLQEIISRLSEISADMQKDAKRINDHPLNKSNARDDR